MLKLTIPGQELWDEEHEQFIYTEDVVLRLEHSLVSISKWEAKWHKPFLSKEPKSHEEDIYYIGCMLDDDIDPKILLCLRDEDWRAIYDYIEDPMTATIINDRGNKKSRATMITNELIYYWMIAYNIPAEYQYWHLNRLLTLIKVCDAKNQKQDTMSKRDVLSENARLNKQRKEQMKHRMKQ